MGVVNMPVNFLCECLHKVTTVFLSHCLVEVHSIPLHISQERNSITHPVLKLYIKIMLGLKGVLERIEHRALKLSCIHTISHSRGNLPLLPSRYPTV